MEIHLPPDQLAVVEALVASGRYRSVDKVMSPQTGQSIEPARGVDTDIEGW